MCGLSTRYHFVGSVLCIAAFFTFVFQVSAQSAAIIQGQVLDQNGDAIPDAQISAILSVVSVGQAQQSVVPKRVLVLYWYNQDYPGNIEFDGSFQAVLRNAGDLAIEYYPEYLESNRFPGEAQERGLRDYLKQKYLDRKIDVVVAVTDPAFDFLLKYRSELFPELPIVFVVAKRPRVAQLTAEPGLTGLIMASTHKETVELALQLQPGTKQLFVISGTATNDKSLEAIAREQLQSFQNRLQTTYLTDLTQEELTGKLKSLPDHSIVLYVWQQGLDKQGRVLESYDFLSEISKASSAPIYGMGSVNIGHGLLGGNVTSSGANGTKTGQTVIRLFKGERAQDIPVEGAPSVFMFDWREMRRWGIGEDALPPGSIVRFKELTAWQRQKWYVIGALSIVLGQAALIGWLLVERRNRRRAEEARRHLAAIVESSHDAIIGTTLDGNILSWNEGAEALYGYTSAEALGRNISLVVPPERREEFAKSMKRRAKGERIENFETIRMKKDRSLVDVSVSVSPIKDDRGRLIADATITRDISDRKQAEKVLRNLTGRLIHFQDEERRRIAGELHDSLGQSLVIIMNRAMICLRDTASVERVTEQLEEICSTATSAIEEVHEIAHNLRPYELDRLGLVKAVETMVNKLANSSSIEFSTELDPIDGLLSREAETSVFRIIQEGLNNVVKHAEATEGTVSVKRTSGQLVIYVSDNGHGIRNDQEELEIEHGLGLAGVAERARMLGGWSAVESTPQVGTKMIVTVQLPEYPHVS